MAKHWTKYLPDIGRALFFKAENQELLTARINRLENERTLRIYSGGL